ncbi:MAG: PRC-barrel domain-containing protein [Celeribacter sp.]|jgi:hypothetical protein
MKRILTTSAIVALMSGPVFAEAHMQEGEADAKVQATGSASYGDFASNQGLEGYRATDFIGKTIYIPEADAEGGSEGELTDPSENWESVGDIGDIILSADGQIKNVIADIGGFLGMGERQVAISMDELDFQADGDDQDDFFLVYNGDRSILEEADEFAWGEGMESEDTANSDQQVAAGTVANDVEANTEEMAADAEVMTEEAGDEVAEAAGEVEENTEEMAAEAEAELDGETDGVVADADATANTETDAAVPATGTTGMAATDPVNAEMQMVPVQVSSVSTDDLIGVSVVGNDDQRIGEIGELIVADDGTINEAIIDVGGFLGIGEKPVAVSFEEIELMREGEGGPLTARVNATEDELEGMNAYEENDG